ncbi:MAG: hypothetical protein WAQ99_08080 [Pyrinomonadaceae bacterium]
MIVSTLYSYKGGAGRTVCSANLVGSLAKEVGASQRAPLILMDLDLDSAGLTHMLDSYAEFENSSWNTAALIQGRFLLDRSLDRNIFFNRDPRTRLASQTIKLLVDAGLPAEFLLSMELIELRKGVGLEIENLVNRDPSTVVSELKKKNRPSEKSIRGCLESLVPAVGAKDISAKVGAPEGSVLFVGGPQVGSEPIVEGDARPNLRRFINECKKQNVAALLIDSASGRQNIANLCHGVSDVMIYCTRLTYQFRVGTKLQLRYFLNKPTKQNKKKPAVVLLPVAVPAATSKWEKLKNNAMDDLSGLVRDVQRLTPCYCFFDGVPEIESFKWVEKILRNDLSDDETIAVGVFEALAAKIVEIAKERSLLADN